MGTVYAVQVRTGYEIKAKEMLKQILKKTNIPYVRNIYALETKTLLNPEMIGVDTEILSNDNVSGHLTKQELNASINNKRKQLEVIERYNDDEHNQIKETYKKEIKMLQKEVSKYRNVGKFTSVLKGYILLELDQKNQSLPSALLNVIKDIPVINKILNQPIPEHEVNNFFNNIKEDLSVKVEISVGQNLDYAEIDDIEKDILTKVNEKVNSTKEKNQLLEELDQYRVDIIEKVKAFIEANKNKMPLLQQIRTYIKRKQILINMPLSLLEIIYANDELKFIRERISSKDFLFKLIYLYNSKRKVFIT